MTAAAAPFRFTMYCADEEEEEEEEEEEAAASLPSFAVQHACNLGANLLSVSGRWPCCDAAGDALVLISGKETM